MSTAANPAHRAPSGPSRGGPDAGLTVGPNGGRAGVLRPRLRSRVRWGMLAAIAGLMPLLPHAEPGTQTSIDRDPELSACAERALPERTMMQKQRVKVVDETGWVRESTRTVYWKRFDGGEMKVLFRVDQPSNEAGLTALLVKRENDDPDLFVYAPDIKRVRRVTGNAISNSILGTDFSYEDAMHFQGFADSRAVTRLADAVVDDHPAYVLEIIPDAELSAYSRIRSYIDQALCLPVRIEFFGHNGAAAKTLVVVREEVREVNGRWIPFRTMMFNHKHESRSVFDISEIEIDTDLRDSLFTPAEIKKSH